MEKHNITEFDIHGREPILAMMPDRSLICTFLTGGAIEPENANCVEVTRSFDGGATWTPREILFDHPTNGVWCTDIFTGGEHPMAAVHLYNSTSQYRELQTLCSFTTDSGRTWSKPTSMRGTVNNCSLRQGFVLSNGDFLIPLYWQEATDNFDKSFCQPNPSPSGWLFRSGIGISSDRGATWQRFGYFAADTQLWEPNAVEVEPGHVILCCRSQTGYLFRTESFDYGRTWSELERTDIPNSDSKFHLFKLRGKILLIGNTVTAGRTGLAIRISDDGKSFTKLIDIEPAEERWFYPHACADEEKEILYIAYENAKQHRLVKYSFAELGLA